MNAEARIAVFQKLRKDRQIHKAEVIAALNEKEEPIRTRFEGDRYEFRIVIEPEVLGVRKLRRRPRGRQGC